MVTTLDQKTALVLIDLQNGITKFPVFRPSGEVIEKAGKLVDAFRAKNLPIIFINVNPFRDPFRPVRTDAPSMAKTQAEADRVLQGMKDGNFFDIVPQLEVQAQDLVITKGTWNAFYATSLHEELQKRGVTGIVLAGIATSIGVEGTARSAYEFRYNVTFAEDAMSDGNEGAHNNSVKVIFPRLGEVGTTGEVIRKLLEIA